MKLAVKSVFVCMCVACLVGAATNARAQSYGASAQVEAPMAARNPEDATAAGTELSLRERPVALETTTEALREVPGVRPSRFGAYGTFSGVQLRGSALGQTAWVFEDVPLSSADGGGFDLSTLPMPLLERLEVYRGGAPLWISQGAIGGVVRASAPTAHGSGVEGSLGGGSFGRVDGRLSAHAQSDAALRVSQYSVLQVVRSEGDFPYHDDNGTRANPDDDSERRFQNAQTLDAAGLSHTRVEVGPGHFDLIVTGFERSGGVPGPGGSQNTERTHRHYWRALSVLAYTAERLTEQGTRLYRVQLSGSFLGQRSQFSDPLGELSAGPVFSDDQWMRGWGRLAGSYALTPWLELTALASHGRDRFEARDRQSGAGRPARRDTTAVAGELRGHGALGHTRAELRASLLALRTQLHVPVVNISRLTLRDEVLWLPVARVSAALEPVRGFTVRSSFSNGGRLPSILEMFGDRPFVLPNRDLREERGWSWDAGVVVSGRVGPLRGQVELTGYWQHLDDLIQFVQTNQNRVIARNTASATLWGFEAGLDGFAGEHLHAVLGLTTTESENHLGDALPYQPQLRLFARQEVPWYFAHSTLDTLTPYVSVEHIGERFTDVANLNAQAPVTRVGAGVRATLWHQRCELSVRVEDLFDARGLDNLNFPLPGRSFFVALTLREELT